jgi:hypothetical protein
MAIANSHKDVREPLDLELFVAFHYLQVSGFPGMVLAEVNAVAYRQCGHLTEI